jgi:hypothetical protein
MHVFTLVKHDDVEQEWRQERGTKQRSGAVSLLRIELHNRSVDQIKKTSKKETKESSTAFQKRRNQGTKPGSVRQQRAMTISRPVHYGLEKNRYCYIRSNKQ